MTESIKVKANLIAAIAENMSDNDWADNILYECKLIRKALDEIEKIAYSRVSGER